MRTLVDRASKRILTRTLENLADGYLEVLSPDGTLAFGDPGADRRALISVHDDRFFQRVLTGSDVGLGEAYMDGDWSSPDLVAVVRLAIRNLALFDDRHRAFSTFTSWPGRIAHFARRNTRSGSRRNIRAHYDLGNEFYRLFLDESMAYSCAVYRSADDTLEDAQSEKFDRICRKLRLAPSDHVLEIGTGWGGFAAWAATRYGCRVTTTTISREQHAWAAHLFARMGLGPDRVRLLFDDYRQLSGRYDKIVSIEMIEAVGHANYDVFFGQCDRLLAPDGSMLIQAITIPDQHFRRYLAARDWIQKYIFPGGELTSVSAMAHSLARATRLSFFHFEDIGAHYARTLHAWRCRFLERLAEVRALGFDDRFIRMWEYYLASCEAAFLDRRVSDVQLVLTKLMNRRPLMNEPWSDARQPAAIESGR